MGTGAAFLESNQECLVELSQHAPSDPVYDSGKSLKGKN